MALNVDVLPRQRRDVPLVLTGERDHLARRVVLLKGPISTDYLAAKLSSEKKHDYSCWSHSLKSLRTSDVCNSFLIQYVLGGGLRKVGSMVFNVSLMLRSAKRVSSHVVRKSFTFRIKGVPRASASLLLA